MDVGYITDVGKTRDNNEDSYYANAEERLFIVADGVGGHNAGEIASKMAVQNISDYVVKNLDRSKNGGNYIFKRLTEGITVANEKIVERSSSFEKYSHMATTVAVLLIKDSVAYISNVGDSRVYLIRNKEIVRLTEDHTMANQLVQEGVITLEEVEAMAQNQVPLRMFSTITRALGDDKGVESDNFFVDIEKGDSFLMCTDGLYDELSDEEILNIIINAENSQKACDDLAQKANENGGIDNITAIIIKIEVEDHE